MTLTIKWETIFFAISDKWDLIFMVWFLWQNELFKSFRFMWFSCFLFYSWCPGWWPGRPAQKIATIWRRGSRSPTPYLPPTPPTHLHLPPPTPTHLLLLPPPPTHHPRLRPTPTHQPLLSAQVRKKERKKERKKSFIFSTKHILNSCIISIT